MFGFAGTPVVVLDHLGLRAAVLDMLPLPLMMMMMDANANATVTDDDPCSTLDLDGHSHNVARARVRMDLLIADYCDLGHDLHFVASVDIFRRVSLRLGRELRNVGLERIERIRSRDERKNMSHNKAKQRKNCGGHERYTILLRCLLSLVLCCTYLCSNCLLLQQQRRLLLQLHWVDHVVHHDRGQHALLAVAVAVTVTVDVVSHGARQADEPQDEELASFQMPTRVRVRVLWSSRMAKSQS
jgi:hypothetical protein